MEEADAGVGKSAASNRPARFIQNSWFSQFDRFRADRCGSVDYKRGTERVMVPPGPPSPGPIRCWPAIGSSSDAVRGKLLRAGDHRVRRSEDSVRIVLV